MSLPDGLDVLRAELSVRQIAHLIEKTAKWVDVDTFKYLPIWYPEDARRARMYKNNWSEPQYNKNRTTGERVHKQTGNATANKALSSALGVRADGRSNWTCCHIWGVDDPKFQLTNVIVSDRRFYSCIANMVLLPSPLKAFTDAMPEIKAMLRVASSCYYNWRPDHEAIPSIDEETDNIVWNNFPNSWPRKIGAREMSGVVRFNATIKRFADNRIKKIRAEYESAGQYYPKHAVENVLEYWGRRDLLSS